MSLSAECLDRIRGALWGLYIADAIAMPVHWYYDRNQLAKDFGQITSYQESKKYFPNSILNKSNTGGGGRGSDQGSIVGDVILHGKKQYWAKGKSHHYHHTLKAGENTLEAQLTRLYTRNLISHNGQIKINDIRDEYIKFMTTPGTHNDTYASTCHRMFFANLVHDKKPPDQCADDDGHNVVAIDALTNTIPIILNRVLLSTSDSKSSEEILKESVREAFEVMSITRRTDEMTRYIEGTAKLLIENIFREDTKGSSTLKENCQKVGRNLSRIDVDREAKKSNPMTACYISTSFPALLILTYKYADSFEEGVLANANAGGENVARGSILGALLGSQCGRKAIPQWMIDGLVAKDEIHNEIEGLLNLMK